MAKRTRKPPIKPGVRRNWLKRHEENGESPPQIAAQDKYDVRTVRKQIDLAKQEREAHEARSLVLRNALELHYSDLRQFAEKLNAQISGAGRVQTAEDDDFLQAALRQHLPRSRIWAYLLERQSLPQKEEEQLGSIAKLIEQAAKSERRLTPVVDAGLKGVIPVIVEVLVAQAKQWSHGNLGITLADNLVAEPSGEGLVSIRYGLCQMGKTDKEHADEYVRIVLDVMTDLQSQLREWQAYRDIEATITEAEHLGRKLRGELAIIRLRRIVPGRCKYCPL
ncbi:MAG: hypothetical protein HY670_02445 [Chloroflexi bacterium]|nr:hypothetical protein [Chloroflexota bacterium]